VEITGGQVSLIHHSLLSQEKLDELLGTSGSPESR
jgi:hypothetical protein